MSLYFITHNQDKFEEINTVIPHIKQFPVDLPEIQEIDAKKIIKEKLLAALKHKKGEFIVEDTSLYLEGLNGLPGPLIRWFEMALENEGIYKLAKKLGNNDASAKTVIGYARNSRELYFFEGELRGKIVAPKGTLDFGWGPIFKPTGSQKTFGQMAREEKHKISMRMIALNKLKKFLEKNK